MSFVTTQALLRFKVFWYHEVTTNNRWKFQYKYLFILKIGMPYIISECTVNKWDGKSKQATNFLFQSQKKNQKISLLFPTLFVYIQNISERSRQILDWNQNNETPVSQLKSQCCTSFLTRSCHATVSMKITILLSLFSLWHLFNNLIHLKL